LSFEQVQDAVLNVARYDVFKLNEAMLAGDTARLARMIDGLKGEGEAHVLVLWAVVEELRVLLRVKRGVAAGKQIGALARENRVWGARERLLGPAVARVSEATLERALAWAARLDQQMKGLTGIVRGTAHVRAEPPPDPWDGLFQLAMMVASPAAGNASAARRARMS
jgi:DNA polymerase III subunit delta